MLRVYWPSKMKMDGHSFGGTFTSTCENDAIPTSLKTFLEYLIKGPSIFADGGERKFSSSVLIAGQIIVFNSVKDRSKQDTVKYAKEKETPFPVYLGIKTHLHADKPMLDFLHSKGICVSYDHVRTLSIDFANSMISFWEDERLGLPPRAVKGMFTTICFDNADWNAKASLAKKESFFHGILIAVHQHAVIPALNLTTLLKKKWGKSMSNHCHLSIQKWIKVYHLQVMKHLLCLNIT